MKHSIYQGLSPEEVIASRAKHGSNVLTPQEKTPLWRQFAEKFRDPLIVILLFAGFLSIGISCYEYFGIGETAVVFFEPVGIFVAIMLATGLAFYFEHQADKEFDVLNQVNDDEPTEVIRSNNTTMIPKRDVVVGDIVILNTGMEIPADGTLLESTALMVDESSLTGEPICHKSTVESDFYSDATFPTNHVMRGTKVMEGHGIMRTTAVGDNTENGRVFVAAQIDNSVKTPLSEQLDRLGRFIARISYSIAAAVVIVRVVYLFTHLADGTSLVQILASILQTLMIAITLIVVAVPEGLPMAITLSLAYSMRRMLKTNNLVRRMHACETMGATTVICTDKTGTLTENKMQMDTLLLLDDEAKDILLESMAVNSTAALDLKGDMPEVIGNPTEGALLLHLHKEGIDYNASRSAVEVVAELPFSTERKFMATTVVSAVDGKRRLYVKGAPEIVMAMCSNIGGDTSRDDILATLEDWQQRAMRTLGFAYADLDTNENGIYGTTISCQNLNLIAVCAIADPVRSDVPAAIEECRNAGIDIKIVTGDTPGTATEIARRIGLIGEGDASRYVITGPEFAALTDKELQERIADLKIISRARPMDKRRLVECLQNNGEVVAVTGDGTNDAPALKAAHVGLSMGDGTAVAKESSDITIIDNSFASIGRAVMWGRSLFQNIQRFLLFQLTVNVSACLIVLAGAFMGTEPPLTVTQMLWVNLIMDTFGAMALASLPPSEKVMRDKPRDRSAFILTRSMMAEIIGVGMVFFIILVSALYIMEHADIPSVWSLLRPRIGARDEMTVYEQTLLFSIFVWTHFWYMFNARAFSTQQSIFRLKMSRGFWSIATIIVVGQLLITEVGYDFFNVMPLLHTHDWHFNTGGAISLVAIIIGSSLVIWVREAWIWIVNALSSK